MKYEQLTRDEMDDEIAAALGSREREHHNYALNLAVYEAILKDSTTLDPEYRKQVEELLRTTKIEMAKVEAIHGGLSVQLPSGNRRANAIQRVKARPSQG